MYDLCAYGDYLMDMFPGDEPDSFIANPGGTVHNMVICAAKLGVKTLAVGRIGKDVMGYRLLAKLEENNVDTSGIICDEKYFTTLSFVDLTPEGERSFSFARQFGADIMLNPEDIPVSSIKNSKIFHYSGMALMCEPSRTTTLNLLKELYDEGHYICTDVSYRAKLWSDEQTAIEVTRKAIPYTHLFKSSDDEALLISGKDTIEDAARYFESKGAKTVLITCGEKGSYFYMDGSEKYVAPYKVDKVVDTTGAGDAFLGGFISRLILLESPFDLKAEMIPEMMKYGNAAGAFAVTKKGGVSGLPTPEDVNRLMEEQDI